MIGSNGFSDNARTTHSIALVIDNARTLYDFLHAGSSFLMRATAFLHGGLHIVIGRKGLDGSI